MGGQIRMYKFYKCIFEKDIETFRKTWHQAVDIKPNQIRSIVRVASDQGFVQGLRFIVQEQGADCLDLDKSDNMFHVACKAGQIEVVKYLITLEEFDKSTTVFNNGFWYFLSSSSETNNIEVVSVLLSSGKLDINKTSTKGVSLLFQAIENRKKRFSEYLIELGAKVTFVDTSKGTWLGNISCICLSAKKVPSLLPALLKRGGNANDVYEKTGQSVLMLAFENDADRKTVEEIVRAGANLSWKDKYGRTVFSMLKSIGQLYGVLDAGITVDDIEKQYHFSTLDFTLCRNNAKKDLLLLLEKGANPNFYCDGETSLLTNACKGFSRSEENVRILLQHGANPNHVDEKGFSVLQNILKLGTSSKAALLLLDFGAKPDDNCLWTMVQEASNDDMWLSLGKRLLEEGADPNEKSEDKQSILSTAIERKCFDLAEELVKYGAIINYIDYSGRSPLDYACILGIGFRELRYLGTVLKYPVKLEIGHVFEHIGVLGKTSDKAYTSNNQHILTFDVKGVFQLFIAGADLMNKRPGLFPLECLRSLAIYGLFESIKFLMRCGWNIDTEKSWIRGFENEENFKCSFIVDECNYTAGVSVEDRAALTAVLTEIENEPTTLQILCRCRIRKQLSSHGQSILPLIEDLPIPTKLKSFLKFEDHENPKEEEVTVNVQRNYSSYRYDDYDDYDDYYDNDDNYYDSDRQEMIFDTESDEWIPIWW
ncbi:putative ankyrin repeat protein RF_0381 [Saccostrea cucullata]|uniref:putative ankyrin repeat protein RF_0381 n=1 Tax=Saccostrea cuccullata TaxID=36930 RepID=UPI002ED273EB